MTARKKIIAISGSTRQQSSNLHLLNAIVDLYGSRLDIEIFRDIAGIPHFNPDLDAEHPPEAVSRFRRLLRQADGILICTPEYAMGVPGTLKNAIDWLVSSMEFSQKPVALITASSLGEKGHRSLLETLKIIESDIPPGSQLLIPFIKTKVADNRITDAATLEQVRAVMESLIKTMDQGMPGPEKI